MSARRSRTRKKAEPKRRGRADLERVRGMSERDIARTSPPELADLPANFWNDAELVLPEPKQAVSLRLDREVLEWFRRGGPKYQTRMNAVLKAYVEHQRGGAPGGE